MNFQGLTLTKGDKLNLTKGTRLKNLKVGLGWSANAVKGEDDYDLDAFYNQKLSACESIKHMGDNRTGNAEGDDEVIIVNLETIPSDVKKILFVVTIHEANKRNQTFGKVKDAYIRLMDIGNSDEVIGKFNLTDNYSFDRSMLMGELIKVDNDWEFKALGEGTEKEFGDILSGYGVC